MQKIHNRELTSALAVALMLALVPAAPAFGQSANATGPREEERAALYREGLSLAESGRWEEALHKFEAVVAIRSAPRALLALATAQEKAGHLVDAKRSYGQVRADAQAAKEGDLVKKATAALAAIEPRLARVTIRLAAGSAGTEVWLDDAPRSMTAEPIEIDPGEHRLMARAPGMQTFEARFRISEGEPQELAVQLLPVEPPPAPEIAAPASAPEPDRTSSWRGPSWPTLVLGGAGATTAVVGWVVRAKGQSAYDDATSGCRDTHCASPAAVESGNDARSRMIAGTVVMGVGALAVVGAGVWWAVSASSSRQATAPRSLAVRFDASPARDGGFVRVTGAF